MLLILNKIDRRPIISIIILYSMTSSSIFKQTAKKT